MAASSQEPLFIKVHDAYTCNAEGRPLFPRQATAGVIYLIRNPLDVAGSYAHHDNRPVNEIIHRMGTDTYTGLAKPDVLYSHLPQKLLSWSGHVRSWVDESGLSVHVVRYEDMASQPVATFTGVLRFAGQSIDTERVQKAIDFSRFDILQAQERAHGFVEKQPTSRSFFRKGQVGSWCEELTEAQVTQIIETHRDVMRRFGYLMASRVMYLNTADK